MSKGRAKDDKELTCQSELYRFASTDITGWSDYNRLWQERAGGPLELYYNKATHL